MEQNLTVPKTRDEFIKIINDCLEEKGFKKDIENDIWTLEKQVMQGGGTIVVNGQKQQMRGEQHDIKMIVEVVGEGSMSDPVTQITESFVEVNFDVEDNGVKNEMGPTFCLFYTDQFVFETMLNQIFHI